MRFAHSTLYGRDCFYPVGKKAKEFIESFPHSSGKRKCLTLDQMRILQKIGAPLKFPKSQEKMFKLLLTRRKGC